MTTRSANADTRIDDDDDDDDDGDVAMSSGGDCPLDQCVDPSVNPDSVSDHQNDSGGENDDIISSSLINKAELIKEQRDDETLRGCWKLAERGRGNFLIDDGVLYRREKILGQPFQQLVVPKGRRSHVLKVGHETYGGHMSVKKTKARISYTFFWPGLKQDCEDFIKTCRICQMKSRVTYRDRVPIKPIPRADRVFDHFFADCLGSLFPSEGSKPKFNYAFVAVDSFSRFPFCVPLRNLTAKSGTNFTSQLTREFERRMGCSPRFNSPYHPSSTGLAERERWETLKPSLASWL